MIFGIGVDTATVERIEASLARGGFAERVYGPQERAELEHRPAQSWAAAFAAKEALGKALGVGLTGFCWQEAQVLHGEKGAPYLSFGGELAGRLAGQGLRAHLSLTHEGGFATAFVILEKPDE